MYYIITCPEHSYQVESVSLVVIFYFVFVLITDASPLSLDPNTVQDQLVLSDDDRRVMFTGRNQGHPDLPERFTKWLNVLSREALPGLIYSEIESSGENVEIAVCYKEMNRKDEDLSEFGRTDQSWRLCCGGPDGAKHYQFSHNNIETAVSGPASSTVTIRFGMLIDQPGQFLRCYSVDVEGNKMTLLHTEQVKFTKDPYLGINTSGTAEVCKIW